MMHIRLMLYILTALLLQTGSAEAAPRDSFRQEHGSFFRLYFPDRSDLDLSYRYEPMGEESDGPGEYELHLFGAGGELAYPLSDDTFLRTGGIYEGRSYDFTEAGDGLDPGTLLLHRITARVGAGIFLTDNLLLTTAFFPGVYSDFSNPGDSDAYDLQGEALLVFRLNPGTQLLIGAERSRAFEDNEYLPLAGLRLLSEDGRLHISLTVPREIKVGYSFSPELQLYVGGWTYGDEWKVEVDDEEFEIALEERRVGIGFQWFMSRHLNLSVETGALVDSTLELQTDRADGFEDGSLDPSPYLSLILGISL